MKKNHALLFIVFILLSIASCKVEEKKEPVKKAGIADFLGQWTIDVKGGGVSWIEVRQENGYLDGDLLWIGGSVSPVSNLYVTGKNLIVTSTGNVILIGALKETSFVSPGSNPPSVSRVSVVVPSE